MSEDRVEMWMRQGTGADGGMFFVASEPMELVMINIRRQGGSGRC